jgi:hypothetical protein
MANFMSKQLELDMKRNESVSKGTIISPAEADKQADEWEKVRFSYHSKRL